MEIKKPKIKSMQYEDFQDNEYLEKMVAELNAEGTNVLLGKLDDLINWGRSNSLWPLTFATSCCGIEFMALGAARYDMARFGFEVARASPRQADMIMVCGTITDRMAPVLKRLYDQMPDPKYVVAVGGCAVSGGPFKKSYHVVNGVDQIMPVDVYIPGCPPRPAWLDASPAPRSAGRLARRGRAGSGAPQRVRSSWSRSAGTGEACGPRCGGGRTSGCPTRRA